MPKIIPAILPQTYTGIIHGADRVHECVDTIQIDFVDGVFAPNQTWLFNNKEKERFSAIEREDEGLPYWDTLDYEFDLMVQNPLEKMDLFMALGPTKLIFHIGSFKEEEMLAYFEGLPLIIKETISFGMAVGVDTDIALVEPYRAYIDTIQCMGIAEIGVQGKPFDERVLTQIQKAKELFPEKRISVDGGVSLATAPALVRAGADTLVVGSALFGSTDIYGTIELLENIGNE